jgi:RNA polymerase sigma factor (sigma-70 family)
MTAGSVFATTHWSVVLAAGGHETTRAGDALEVLCRSYWHPLYHYLRRRGFGPEDAQDLTQGFFAKLIQRRAFAKADPQRGRFRSFLLASLKHFLADEWDRARAEKRGGGETLRLDFQSEETRLEEPPARTLTPDEAYERRWAMLLLEQVYGRLAAEFEHEGRGAQFQALRVALAGDRGAVPYAEIGRQTGLSEGAVKVAVHRLRQRYRALLRATIAETVAAPEEVEDELRHLLRVLAG